MTLPHHDAAERNQWCGGETEFLGPEHRCDDDIATGFELSVCLQSNPAAQVIHHKGLMRLGDAEFPWQTGVLDARQRRCACATFESRYQNIVGVPLGNSGRDGADADFRHELYADASATICILQVKDQLRQIFDGVNVVMWRGTDQTYAWS